MERRLLLFQNNGRELYSKYLSFYKCQNKHVPWRVQNVVDFCVYIVDAKKHTKNGPQYTDFPTIPYIYKTIYYHYLLVNYTFNVV